MLNQYGCGQRGDNYTKLKVILLVMISLSLSSPVWASDKKMQQYLVLATKYYNAKNYEKADRAFSKLRQINAPLSVEFYYYHGRVGVKLNKLEEAQSNLESYLELVGNDGRYSKKAKALLSYVNKQLNKKSDKKSDKKQQRTANRQADKAPNTNAKEANKASFNRRQESNNTSTSKLNKTSKQKESAAKAKGAIKALKKGAKYPTMVKIAKGRFTMGANWGDKDHTPPRSIRMAKDFYISQTEVTFKQYAVFAKATNRKMPDDSDWGKGDRPVINVSWFDAVAYARWLGDAKGGRYRLPTEAEWEYIAKFKPKNNKNKYGHTQVIGRGDANCDGGRYFWEAAKTKEVGQYEPSPAGLYDVFGNVWEWTCSPYTKRYDGREEACLRESGVRGKTMAVRGGSWRTQADTLRAFVRYNNFPDYKNDDLGFRVVKEVR